MKKLRYILGTGLLLPAFVLSPVMALAHDGETEDSSAASQSSVKTTVATEDKSKTGKTEDTSGKRFKIGEPSTDATLMKKRVDELKLNLKIKLDDKTKARLVLKCKPAQTIVQTAEKNDNGHGSKRETAYTNIVEKLNGLITKLKANSIDTTALEAAVATLETKIATFTTDMTTYKQALADVRAIDCAADPAAFQAALTAARADREKVRADSADIRAFIKDTLKPAIEAIKAELKAAKEKEKADEKETSGGNQ